MTTRRQSPATFKRPPRPASMRGLQSALAVLYGPAQAIDADEMLAECGRLKRETDDRLRRQGELRLRSKGRM